MPPEAPASLSDPLPASRLARPGKLRWVPETKFGHWFLGTNVWARYVVEVAINDLSHLLPVAARRPRRILDAGCGPGVSLPLLDRQFQPEVIIGLDIDPKEVARSNRQAPHCRCRVEILRGDAVHLPLPDASVDMVLCHQLLHHVVAQQEVLREIRRVLVPGGFLLLSESCRDFIHSAPVRLLFRHPNEVQRTAAGYQQLVQEAGFEFGSQHVKTSIPFWSLPDWGLRQKFGWKPKSSGEPTEITLVASKPVGT